MRGLDESQCKAPKLRETERLTLGGSKVDDVSVLLEHVDLLDSLDGLNIDLLKSSLELLVVGSSGLVDLLDLAAGSSLSSNHIGELASISIAWISSV